MKEIVLSNGMVALVDDEDYERLVLKNWSCLPNNSTVYAYRHIYQDGLNYVSLMHVEVIGKRVGFVVDHIDRNGLNNQRTNLRHATYSQNRANSIAVKGVSKYKGVTWDEPNQKWRAKIRYDYRDYHLGRYVSEEEAARAYDVRALAVFGDFASLNLPDYVDVAR